MMLYRAIACSFALLCLWIGPNLKSHAQNIRDIAALPDVSFRGLDTYGNDVVWVSGSKGTVGRSVDQGATWTWVNPVGHEAFDFRDIAVFGKNEAVIVSAGSLAVILRTTDGGRSWSESYRNTAPDIFLNGMDFSGKKGFALGDPIDGVFQLLQTSNKGKTWTDVSNRMVLFAENNEVAFAASGTSIHMQGNNVWVGSGGSHASVFRRNEKELLMYKSFVPVISGKASQGIFSIQFWDDLRGIVVGGDYENPTDSTQTVMLTKDGGDSWYQPYSSVAGYRSAVVYVNEQMLLATGTSGTDLSTDGGHTWTLLTDQGYNAVRISKSGRIAYFAGNGKVGMWNIHELK